MYKSHCFELLLFWQSLLELLEDRADEEVCLPLCSILCLMDLCRHLHVRLLAVSDPVLHCPNQGDIYFQFSLHTPVRLQCVGTKIAWGVG